MKKIFKSLFLVGILLVSFLIPTKVSASSFSLNPKLIQVGALTKQEFKVTIDGKAVNFTNNLGYPEIVNDRTMVPLRIISEDMGYSVDWNEVARKVTITDKDKRVEISIGDSISYVNGQKKNLDSAAYIKGDRTYVPLRFISESFGARVGYESKTLGDTRTHIITIETGAGAGGYYNGIYFDPVKDTLPDGRMTEEKTIEFLNKMVDNTRIYKENGRYYVEYKEIDLPEGWRTGKTIAVLPAFGSSASNILMMVQGDPLLNLKFEKIPMSGDFKRELNKATMDNLGSITIGFGINKVDYTGHGGLSSMSWSIEYNHKTGNMINGINDKTGTTYAKPFNNYSIFKGIM